MHCTALHCTTQQSLQVAFIWTLSAAVQVLDSFGIVVTPPDGAFYLLVPCAPPGYAVGTRTSHLLRVFVFWHPSFRAGAVPPACGAQLWQSQRDTDFGGCMATGSQPTRSTRWNSRCACFVKNGSVHTRAVHCSCAPRLCSLDQLPGILAACCASATAECVFVCFSLQVAVAPGGTFGQCSEGHVRISLAASHETVRSGMTRLCEFILENAK